MQRNKCWHLQKSTQSTTENCAIKPFTIFICYINNGTTVMTAHCIRSILFWSFMFNVITHWMIGMNWDKVIVKRLWALKLSKSHSLECSTRLIFQLISNAKKIWLALLLMATATKQCDLNGFRIQRTCWRLQFRCYRWIESFGMSAIRFHHFIWHIISLLHFVGVR